MKINFTKTRENLKLVKIEQLARLEGFSSPIIRQVIHEVYPHPHSPKAQAVLEMLKRRGYLVEE